MRNNTKSSPKFQPASVVQLAARSQYSRPALAPVCILYSATMFTHPSQMSSPTSPDSALITMHSGSVTGSANTNVVASNFDHSVLPAVEVVSLRVTDRLSLEDVRFLVDTLTYHVYEEFAALSQKAVPDER